MILSTNAKIAVEPATYDGSAFVFRFALRDKNQDNKVFFHVAVKPDQGIDVFFARPTDGWEVVDIQEPKGGPS